jgi:hypothetical protein
MRAQRLMPFGAARAVVKGQQNPRALALGA